MAPRVITPDQLNSTQTSASYRLDLDGERFDFLSSYKSHSVSYVGNDTLRFELRDGEQFNWDTRSGVTSERAQIASKTLFGNNEPVGVSFGLNIEQGAPNTAKWLVLGQLHLAEWTGNLTGKSPPVEVGLEGERMVVYIRYDKADGTVVKQAVYTDLHDIQRGHDYDIDIQAVFDPAGNGRLVITRDGTMLADYSGPLGYQQQLKVLWGQGIYREGSAKETMVAEFSDLHIKSGSAVTFPDKSAFIDAPTLDVTHVGAAAKDGTHKVDITGTAKAGTTVTIFDGTTVLGKASVAADGTYSLSVKIDDDLKNSLSAIATDATGRSGIEMKAQSVVVGTGAEIGAQLKALVGEGDVAAIVITDGTVIKASSSIFSYIFKYGQDVLSKIQGNYSFYDSVAVTGKSYNRQDFSFDSKGVLLEMTRYTAGVKTFTETYKADGSIHNVSINPAGLTDVKDISPTGLLVRFEQYSAKGTLLLLQTKSPDGSSADHFYDATTGLETRYVLKAADGSKEVGWLGLKGRAFTTEIYTYDPSGKTTGQERFDADGTKIFDQVWNKDGSRQIDNFDAVTGDRTSFTLYAADGSRVETKLVAGDPYSIVSTISYNAAGAVIGKTTGGTLPQTVHQVPVPTGPTTVYAVDGATGLKNGATVTEIDGSKVVLTFVPGKPDAVLSRSHFDADGRKTLSETFDAAGTRLSTKTFSADGSYVEKQVGLKGLAYDTLVSTHDASGKLLSTQQMNGTKIVLETSFAADGSTLQKSVAADGQVTKTALASDGSLTLKEVHDASGRLLFSDHRAADGSRDAKTYDGATGALTNEIRVNADASQVMTSYEMKDKVYATRSLEYDASGKMVEQLRYFGDANKTLQFRETHHADGSSEVRTYDSLGREVSSVLTSAANVKDTFAFTFSGTGNQPTRVHHEHFEDGRKVYVDATAADGSHTQISMGSATLHANAGVKDIFTGGSGSDTFVFGKDSGKDVIWQFAASGPNQDKIVFDHAGVTRFEDLKITAQGAHTLITYDGGDAITLYNVKPSQIHADAFSFI